VNTASKPASVLTAGLKQFKQAYNRGRRDLEHEFGKTMRYKSIRDLVAGDTGLVIRDLKPVWLMSPLSVSDTLPLNAENFDVVIFDEASQIMLEEAIPSLFRARQAIVVGDEMQLPPTSFFMASREEEEDEFAGDENGQLVPFELDGNSFLNHAARNLPSCMLGWHYRSQSEALISFSNHAFYDGHLLTVPDVRRPARGCAELVVGSPTDAAGHADQLLSRAVSFHFMQHATYEQRCNAGEAAYIAGLVRRILEREEGHSIGIVAFSEAQQAQIEAALQSLAAEDSEFARRLEIELEREQDEQFVGLLVKNLENIQGDERDVIIMSVCYGPAPDGKVRMNFGPINQSGGQKRLNVAFSRARRHMALVSSMRSTAITNDYNEGANCLKNYLRYAEAASIGDAQLALQILRTLSQQRAAAGTTEKTNDAVVEQLAQALAQRGYRIDRGVGQSHFRCDLAVCGPDDAQYRLGILVDTADWYRQRDLVERELLKPDLLTVFGWRIHVVLARDWYEDHAGTLERIERLLAGVEPPEPDDEWSASEPEPLLNMEPTQPFNAPVDNGESTADDDRLTEDRGASVGAQSADDAANRATREPSGSQSPSADNNWSQYLEFVQGGSSKFWEISVNGSEQTIRFGRIGSQGQTLTKTFDDGSKALDDAKRQANGKRRKGYRPV
jgi:predicted DNA-binding WGR domain protein